jgi:hypothetical protein
MPSGAALTSSSIVAAVRVEVAFPAGIVVDVTDHWAMATREPTVLMPAHDPRPLMTQ